MLGLATRPATAASRRAQRCCFTACRPAVSEGAAGRPRRVCCAPARPAHLAATRPPARPVTAAAAAARPPPPASPPWTTADQAWLREDLAVVLVNPRIPHNTGATARTAAAAGVPLHIVGPVGFSLADRDLRRAGLDYWASVAVGYHEDWAAFVSSLDRPSARLVAFSKFGAVHHATPGLYAPPSPAGRTWLLFGAETTGLPPEAHAEADAVVRVPIVSKAVRSLNLAVSAGVGVFEALRQLDGAVLTEETSVGGAVESVGGVGVR